MASSQTPGLYPGDYDWNQPLISAAAVNQPAVEVWGEELEGDLLELFLRIPPGSPRHYYQARAIEAICPANTLGELGQGVINTFPKPIAWLDDRSRTGQRREAGGWLAQAALYEALKAKRVQDDEADAYDIPNADRRLLYIPNPDFRSLGPMILTASCQQALVLSGFLWKYLKADWSIGVSFPDDGRSFSLEFHIPYYVWTKAKYVPRDKRVRPDKSPLRKKSALRKSILLSFLTKPRATAEEVDILDCLHEAQWSCVVVGYNNTVWNGYGLTDTYFYDADSPFDRTTFRYFQDDDLPRDPISGLEANLPVQNPREYFLTALRARVKDIKEEWEHIISRLGQEMEYFIKDIDVFLGDDISSLGAADDRSKALQELELSTKQVSRLLTNFTQRISNLNKAWESFKTRDLHYFHELNENGRRPGLTLHAIDETFTELQTLQVELENLRNKHGDFNKSLELYLQVENRRAIVLQQYNINLIQIISPPALTAAMMQSGVLPWKSGFLPWVVITAVLWTLTAAVRPILTWYHRCMGPNPRPALVPPLAEDAMPGSSGWTQVGLWFPQPTFARHPRGRFQDRQD
ncbi:hypothetical protein BKA60DRAFT_641343 [Fusarium oxysporum]|nr:hypothetical protein BKA60DRAFT_641343 [Fusarium oxysporum]